jgi:hypothetical protein
MAKLRFGMPSTEGAGFNTTWDDPSGVMPFPSSQAPNLDMMPGPMSNLNPNMAQGPMSYMQDQDGGFEGSLPGPVPPGQPRVPPGGFDLGGGRTTNNDSWGRSNKPFDYEDARDSWMSGKYGRDEAGARQWASEKGIDYNGGDTIWLPNGGGMIDILGNFKSGRDVKNNWTAAGFNGDNPNGGGNRAPGPMNYASGGAGGPQNDITEQLKKLFPDGMFNKDLVTQRTGAVRDDMERFRKSRLSSNQAALAERGLIGSGAEASAQNRAEGDIADQYMSAAQNIYGDEARAADSRMMQAMGLAGQMSMADAQNAIDWFKAQSDRDLGYGNLALGNRRVDSDYTLGRGQYDLGRARLDLDRDQGDMDALIRILQQLYGGANTSAGGYY